MNLLLNDTLQIAVDQTDFRKVRFGRVKKALPAWKVVQWSMLSEQGAAVNI